MLKTNPFIRSVVSVVLDIHQLGKEHNTMQLNPDTYYRFAGAFQQFIVETVRLIKKVWNEA